MAYQNAYALTGGIASGKSTVCSLLRIHGFEVVDADAIAKTSLESLKEEVVKLFGKEILHNGAIDRKRLADIIFSSKEKREALNALMHPLIRETITKKAELLDEKGYPFILDIPLLFESGGYESKMRVVVYTPKETQLQRLVNREGLSFEDAQKRIDSQMDIEVKKQKADWVIDNSKDLKHLQAEVEKFVDFIRGEYVSIKI